MDAKLVILKHGIVSRLEKVYHVSVLPTHHFTHNNLAFHTQNEVVQDQDFNQCICKALICKMKLANYLSHKERSFLFLHMKL